MNLESIVGDQKVGLFLNADPLLIESVRKAGAREIAVFTRRPAADANTPGVKEIRYRRNGDVRRNNADVLLLDGSAAFALRNFRIFGHARYMMVNAGLASSVFLPLVLPHLLRRRLAYRGLVRAGGSPWLAFENTNRKFAAGPRFYASISGGMAELGENLRGLNYCVLRWHRRLGEVEKLSDIDILVTNEDSVELIDRLNRKFGFFPVDIFTVASAKGHNTAGMSYYPPTRATELLDHCIEGRYGERRPDAKYTLLSFSYHLLFHKGIRSLGNKDELGPSSWIAPHYYEELMLLCDEGGVPRFVTLQDLEKFLREHHWFPPEETLNKIAKKNVLVKERFYRPAAYLPGLTVFVLREIAVRHNLVADIERMVSEYGFDVVRSVPLPEDVRRRVAAGFRGGNWYSLSDREPEGGPAHCIVACDRNPIPLSKVWLMPATRSRYEHIDNYRTLRKTKIRDRAARLLGNWRLNSLHASDNTREALDYVKVVSPDLYESLENRFSRKSEGSNAAAA